MITTETELWQALQSSAQVIISAVEYDLTFASSADFRFFCEDYDIAVVADLGTKITLSWTGFPFYQWMQDVAREGALNLNSFPDSLLAELFHSHTTVPQAVRLLTERGKNTR